MNKILLIDDDHTLSELLQEYLQAEEFECQAAYTGPDGLSLASSGQSFDLIILDIMLPGMTGIEVLKEIRKHNISTPILMLTAKGDDVDRILGLELGADDYVPKPCNPRELLARIKAILRRSQSAHSEQNIKQGSIKIFPQRMEALYLSTELKLTGAEFKVLETLNQNIGSIVSKEKLCELALGRKLTLYDRSVDVHVSNLRKKLVEAGAINDIIMNQRGTGYLLKDES
jgi:two-component system response regulator CpxR